MGVLFFTFGRCKSLRLDVVFLTFGGYKFLRSGVINPYVREIYLLTLRVVRLTFGGCISYGFFVNPYVPRLYFLRLGVVNAYVWVL